MVRELIRRRLGKYLGLSTVQLYLQRWGFTPQKPLSRATQRSDAAIQFWLEREYPKMPAARSGKRHLYIGVTKPGSAIRIRSAGAMP